jgi:hypothetical protein
MREAEIKEEFELGVRAFLEAEERSKAEAVDNFKEIRVLESAFNRLFLAVEHFCNALVLFETGNYSPKHFGDAKKLKELKEKYNVDFQRVYEDTYSFRSYGDYRKFPEIEEKFNRQSLLTEINNVKVLLEKVLDVISKKLDLQYLITQLK